MQSDPPHAAATAQPLVDQRLLAWLLGVRLEWLFLSLMAVGLALIVASWMIGLDDVRFDPSTVQDSTRPVRQVGYVFAANWGLTYLVFFPIIGAMLVGVLQDIPRVLRELRSLDVLHGPNETDGAAAVLADWTTGGQARRWFVIVLGLASPIAYSLYEWYGNNLLRLMGRGPRAEVWDWDWGLKCAMPEYVASCGPWLRASNMAFDCATFLAQALYLCLLLCFQIYMLDFRHALLGERAAIRMFPALRLSDQRRGFGQFEPLLTKMLVMVLVSFFVAYAVRVQNLYLRSNATSLWAFVEVDIVRGMFAAPDNGGLKAGSGPSLFDPGGEAGRQTVSVAIGMVFLFSVTASIVVGTVGGAARRAKSTALAYYASPKAQSLFGLELKEELSRTESMSIWPIGYMRLNGLLIWTLFACASLFWFRIGLLVCGASVVKISLSAYKMLTRAFDPEVPRPNPQDGNGGFR